MFEKLLGRLTTFFEARKSQEYKTLMCKFFVKQASMDYDCLLLKWNFGEARRDEKKKKKAEKGQAIKIEKKSS